MASGAIAGGPTAPPASATAPTDPAARAQGAVGSAALAPGSGGSSALAPGSVYGGALREETVHTTPIADLDAIPHNGEWTPSNTEAALGGPGEALLSAGFAFGSPGIHEVA